MTPDTFRAVLGLEAAINGRPVPITAATDGREVIVYQTEPTPRELSETEFPQVYAGVREYLGLPAPRETRRMTSKIPLLRFRR